MQEQIERLSAHRGPFTPDDMLVFNAFKAALNRGEIRAAERDAEGVWHVHAWVKQGLLAGFRMGQLVEIPAIPQAFVDKHTMHVQTFPLERHVRIVPGGSAVRDGAYLAPSVIVMPPSYINIGAWVDEGTMVDSHVLVGTCAQIGKRVHLSAGVQIGGVLEPIGALPVIVEDDVLVGGGCGVYEGTRIGAGAVLAPGVQLTRATPVYDLVHETVHRATEHLPLVIPPNAVVVPGARAVTTAFGQAAGLSLYAPMIVKYRDQRTDLATQLEDALREVTSR